jgi:alpha-L-fucosidase
VRVRDAPGFYYSQSQDWHEPNGAGNTWDFGADEKKDYDQYLRSKAEPQVRELLTGYGPVASSGSTRRA